MEIDAAKNCFMFLKKEGLTIDIFVSDRHKSIAKWIRSSEQTKHFYDIWHVHKSINKKLRQASKESGCEIIGKWLKSVRNHLYWSVQSTNLGFSQLIEAKWKSTVRHMANKHVQHPDELFSQCAHAELEPREWIKMGNTFSLMYM
jgi:hypothetical protein